MNAVVRDERGRIKKGRVPTSGRVRGTPNKTTTQLKEVILETLDRAGGVEYLLTVAQDDPKTFCALLGRVLPLQAQVDVTSGGKSLTFSWGEPDDADIIDINPEDD